MSDQVLIKVVDELYTYGGFTLCSDALFQLETLINHAENHLIPKLCKVADELDEHHFNSAVAKITGGSVGVGGTVAGVGGFAVTTGLVLSPFTLGGSVLVGAVAGGVLAGVGGVIGLAGTGTVLGTQVVKKSLIQSLLKRAQEEIDQHVRYKNKLVEIMNKIDKICYEISIRCKDFGAEAVYNLAWRFFNKVQDAANIEMLKTAISVVNIASQPFWAAVLAVGVVGTGAITLNLFELVNSVKVVHKKEPHPAAVEIRETTIVQLREQLTKLNKIHDKLNAKCESD